MTQKRHIHRLSTVELLDQLNNSPNAQLVSEASQELKRRNLSSLERSRANKEYLNYKQQQLKREHANLSWQEGIAFFLLPFFTPHPEWREDDFSEAEFDRFEQYGFRKKAKQAQRLSFLGLLFWALFFAVALSVYQYNIN